MGTSLIEQITREGAISVTAAAAIFGEFRRGTPTRRQTVVRWMLQGVRLPSGERVKLEHYRIGSRLMTSRARCLNFLDRQQQPAPEMKQTAPKRDKAAREAGRRLAALGA